MSLKRYAMSAFLCGIIGLAGAQTSAKRYIFLEHFTNSRCSNCASQNPGFFNTIANYEDDIHLLTFHPPIPYNNCAFYLDNPTENVSRTGFYGIVGTPRVVRNGTASSSASQVTASMLDPLVGQTSPIQIVVTESDGTDRQVNAEVRTLGFEPSGNLRLFAAIVEREVQYNAPNGENLHHHVFRKMLSAIDGDPFVPALMGGSVNVHYEYTLANAWKPEETYVLVFLQDIETKEIFNSGSRFDEVATGTDEAFLNSIRMYPNPVTDALTVANTGPAFSGSLHIIDATGRTVMQHAIDSQQSITLNLGELPTGIYLASLSTAEGQKVEKLIKK